MIEYIGARLRERSTWMFWLGSLGTVAAYPYPMNIVGAVALFAAGLMPDKTISSGQ